MDTTVKSVFAFFVVAGSIVAAGPTIAQCFPTKPLSMVVS